MLNTLFIPDKKLNLRVHIKNAIKFYAWLFDLESIEKTIYKLNSHEQNKRTLQRCCIKEDLLSTLPISAIQNTQVIMLRVNFVETTSACEPASIFACPQCGMHHLEYMRYLWCPQTYTILGNDGVLNMFSYYANIGDINS